jgi:hypothetical protein
MAAAKKEQKWCQGTELDRTSSGEICVAGSSVMRSPLANLNV